MFFAFSGVWISLIKPVLFIIRHIFLIQLAACRLFDCLGLVFNILTRATTFTTTLCACPREPTLYSNEWYRFTGFPVTLNSLLALSMVTFACLFRTAFPVSPIINSTFFCLSDQSMNSWEQKWLSLLSIIIVFGQCL